MSTLRVSRITNANDDGAVEFSKGATLPSGQTIVNNSDQNVIEVNTSTGVVTATDFSGDGSQLTGMEGVSRANALGVIFVS